jgi:hypothetical protein
MENKEAEIKIIEFMNYNRDSICRIDIEKFSSTYIYTVYFSTYVDIDSINQCVIVQNNVSMFKIVISSSIRHDGNKYDTTDMDIKIAINQTPINIYERNIKKFLDDLKTSINIK